MAKQKTKDTLSDLLRKSVQSKQTENLSLRDLAKQAKIDVSQLSRFMSGQRDLTLEAASRLAKVVGMEFVLPQTSPAEDTKVDQAARKNTKS